MMQEDQTISALPSMFQAKVEPQMNSQGEIIAPQPEQQQSQQSQEPAQLPGNYDDVLSLADTELAIQSDSLCPPTDDTGLEHKIISCGHVLKSTHDLARWSEKTGARRVNGIESLDAVSDLAINLEPNRGRNNQGNAGNTNTNNNQGSADASEDISGLFNEGGKGGRGRRGRSAQQQQWRAVEGEGLKSEVINCWPVLKSTHDQAQLSEKRGRNAVNQADTSGALDELALNQGQGQRQGKGQGQGQGQGGQQRRGRGQRQGGRQQQQASSAPNEPSVVLNSWPVLKSTHDMATLAEKRGESAVNQAGGAQVLDEVIQNTEGQQQGIQAGGGSSLQSGLDTQGGSHVQDSAQ